MTCIAATHAPVALRRADEILFLKDAHLVGRGTFEHLVSTGEKFRRLWEDDRPEPSRPPPSSQVPPIVG